MIISRYLTKEVYSTFFATTVVLLLVFTSNQFVRYMHLAASGELSSHIVTLLLLLQLPVLLTLLLPLSLFIALLMVYGRLHLENEMTIFATCGINTRKILKITLEFSSVIIFLIIILSLWIGPKLSSYSDHIIAGGASSTLELLIPNHFQTINKDQWVVYVDATSRDKNKLQHVFAAEQPTDTDPNKIQSPLGIVVAKNGDQVIDQKSGNAFLVLNQGYRYAGTPGQNDYQIIKYDKYGFRLQQANDSWQHDESDTPTLTLWHEINNHLATAELQWRFSLPIMGIILVFLGIPLSKVKPRYGRYSQLIPAILLYVVYAQLLFLSRAWLKKDMISPYLGMWWVHSLMGIVALLIYAHQIGWRRIWYKFLGQ